MDFKHGCFLLLCTYTAEVAYSWHLDPHSLPFWTPCCVVRRVVRDFGHIVDLDGITWHRSSACNHPVSLEKVPSLIISKGGCVSDKAICAFPYKVLQSGAALSLYAERGHGVSTTGQGSVQLKSKPLAKLLVQAQEVQIFSIPAGKTIKPWQRVWNLRNSHPEKSLPNAMFSFDAAKMHPFDPLCKHHHCRLFILSSLFFVKKTFQRMLAILQTMLKL